jgi:carbon-monoxide dehydrogenase medium subunit
MMWQAYYTVRSAAEALELLAHYRERARVIAGGTDLLIELDRGARRGVEVIIDISRARDLDGVTLNGDSFRIGALVTHNDVVNDPRLLSRALPLAQACWEVGAPQIRNRATVAGNVITASPANDTITPLMTLSASVTLASQDGERTIPLNQFYTGYRRTAMRPDELLTAISFPALGYDECGVFLKLGLRRAQAISVINCAIVLAFEPDSRVVRRASIALGCVAPMIFMAEVAAASLVGRPLTSAGIAEAARLAAAAPSPIDDVRGSAAYRVEMIRVLVTRALRALAQDDVTELPSKRAMLWGERHGKAALPADVPTPLAHGHEHGTPISTTLNGVQRVIETGTNKTLLRWLREDAGLPGTKEGCSEGECGACTVYLDGAAVMACMVPAGRAHGAELVTIEGLNAHSDDLHPVQQGFIETGAVQCGYCTPGFVMAAAKLLEEQPDPSQAEIEQSISGNLCRCTGYYAIIDAIRRAAKLPGGTQTPSRQEVNT